LFVCVSFENLLRLGSGLVSSMNWCELPVRKAAAPFVSKIAGGFFVLKGDSFDS
jgi:hypothetical protein